MEKNKVHGKEKKREKTTIVKDSVAYLNNQDPLCLQNIQCSTNFRLIRASAVKI